MPPQPLIPGAKRQERASAGAGADFFYDYAKWRPEPTPTPTPALPPVHAQKKQYHSFILIDGP